MRGCFVGRARELDVLRAALVEAIEGRGRVVLLSGEAGIGKTRTAEEFAREAQQHGAEVLWGRCHEGDGAPALWPWVQVLRSCVRGVEDGRLLELLGDGGPELAAMVPVIRDRVPDLAPALPGESPEARFRLFDGVSQFLAALARRTPRVVVFDDLHAADPSSLLLLQFVARHLRRSRLLLLGTYREMDLDSGHPLIGTLIEIEREPSTERIELPRLSTAEVGQLVTACTGAELPAAAAALRRQTEGNPLFVVELLRMLAAENRLGDLRSKNVVTLSIPSGIRVVIDRRLAPLSDVCRSVLRIATVVGRRFPTALVQAIAAADERTVGLSASVGREGMAAMIADALEEAAEAGVVTRGRDASDCHVTSPHSWCACQKVIPEASGPHGCYRFGHWLIADVLYRELSVASRAGLHRAAAQVIERTGEGPRMWAELADHYHEASRSEPGVRDDAEKILACARRAAQEAVELFAYEEGARLYRLALEAVRLGAGADERQRAELWYGLGEALHRAGDAPAAHAALETAATLARRLGDSEMLACVALVLAGRFAVTVPPDPAISSALEEALAAQDEKDSPLRVRLMARLALELARDGAPEHAVALSRDAIGMARRVGEPGALARAFGAWHLIGGAVTDPRERLSVGDEIVRLAEQAHDLEIAAEVRGWRADCLLEIGDIAALDREILLHARLAEQLREPAHLGLARRLRAMRALHDGDLEAGERLADEALALAEQAPNPGAEAAHVAQLLFVRGEQGRLEEAPGRLEDLSKVTPLWRVGLAYVYAHTGRAAEARALLDRLMSGGVVTGPRDRVWLAAMALLAETVSAVGEVERAAELYANLLPYADRNVSVIGATLSHGAVARYLALLAATASRWDDAEEHFTAALAMNRRMGATPFVAHTQCDYAAMLLQRDRPTDRTAAAELLEEATALARPLGMARLLAKAEALGERLSPPAGSRPVAPHAGAAVNHVGEGAAVPHADPLGAGAWAAPGNPGAKAMRAPVNGANLFRKEGDYWTIRYAGVNAQLKDTKGLVYLGHLLRHPGREYPAAHLVALISGDASALSAGPAQSDLTVRRDLSAVPELIIDAQAKAAYRTRLAELREEIDSAEGLNDIGRTARARVEMEHLVAHLRGSVGFGGQTRTVTSALDRARSAVTKRIRSEVRRVGDFNPALARHLAATITTGYLCSYQPARDVLVNWVV